MSTRASTARRCHNRAPLSSRHRVGLPESSSAVLIEGSQLPLGSERTWGVCACVWGECGHGYGCDRSVTHFFLSSIFFLFFFFFYKRQLPRSRQPSGHLQRGRGHAVTLGPGPQAVPLLHGRAVRVEHPSPVVGLGGARGVLADDNPPDEVVATLHVVTEHLGAGNEARGRRGTGQEVGTRQRPLVHTSSTAAPGSPPL